MTTKDIENVVLSNINMLHSDLYNKLLQTFSEVKINFVMYSMYKYIHDGTEEKNKRKDQNSFKKSLIHRYGKCVISGSDEFVCEACHIIPFASCDNKDKYNVDNGILLRTDLHKLFDEKLLKIDPKTFCVIIHDSILSNSKMHYCWDFNGMKININKNSKKFLEAVF